MKFIGQRRCTPGPAYIPGSGGGNFRTAFFSDPLTRKLSVEYRL